MSYERPGTYVDEVLLTTTAPVNDTTAAAAFVAAAPRGPVGPTKFSSWSDVTKAFGQFTGVAANDVLLQALYDYFIAGGRDAWAVRAIGSASAAATQTFLLDATPGPGDPALVLTATNPGVWANRVYVEVTAGATGRFNLTVRLVPTGSSINNQQIVERWSDLSLDPADSRYALGILNSVVGGSSYLVASLDSGYTFTTGDTVAASTVAGGDALAGGADGGSVSNSVLQAAVLTLDVASEPLVLNLPGVTNATVIASLADYADPNRNRSDGEPGRGDVFVVVDSAPGVDSASAITTANSYPDSDYLAVYYPNIVVADPSTLTRGATKLVPAGPSVVGRFIATDSARGTHKSPAGVTDGLLTGALALDPAATLRNPQLDALNVAGVNAIKSVPNRGICIFGARTLKSSAITKYISARRTLIQARVELLEAVAFAPFEDNDEFLWGSLAAAADKVLRAMHTAGALKGDTDDQAYYVKCDSGNNTESTIEAGEVHLEVGLAPQRPAEFVVLRIGQTTGSVTVDETAA